MTDNDRLSDEELREWQERARRWEEWQQSCPPLDYEAQHILLQRCGIPDIIGLPSAETILPLTEAYTDAGDFPGWYADHLLIPKDQQAARDLLKGHPFLA